MEDAITIENSKHNQEQSVVDNDVIKRREARRRKILSNAKSRLEKLNGKIAANNTQESQLGHESNADDSKYTNNCEYSDPEVEPTINVHTSPLENSYNLPDLLTNDISELFLNDSNLRKTQNHSKHHILLNSPLHILVISLITCIGTFLWPITVITTPGVFTLSSIYIVIDVMYLKRQQATNPIIHILLTVLGLRTHFMNTLTNLLVNIQYVIADLGLFIFSFCSLSYLLILIDTRFENFIKVV